MTRRIILVFAYVLLLAMQQEGHRHDVEHLRSQLAQSRETAASLPAAACVECELLASAAHAVGARTVLSVSPAAAAFAPAVFEDAAPAFAAHHYSARGPPLRS